MNNLVYNIEYLKIPHPLESGKYIIKSHDYQFERLMQEIYPLYTNPLHNFPRIQRKVYDPFNSDQNELKEKVKNYDRNLWRKIRGEIGIKIVKGWARLGVCFAISYIIWTLLWSFPWLYASIDAAFRAIGDFLSPYAIGVMILAPSIAGFYFTLTGKNSLFKLYKKLKPLEFYPKLGEDHTIRFIEDLKILNKNIRKKAGRSHPVVKEIETLTKYIQEKNWDKIKGALDNILNYINEDPHFPWSEKENVIAMTEDLLYHLSGKFTFAPLKVISSNHNNKIISPKEKEKLAGLSHLFASREFVLLREKILSKFDSLTRASSTKERMRICQEISFLFNKMVFLCSSYHLGDSYLPYEKGRILKDFYYHLFVTFGKMSFFLRKKKPGNFKSSLLIRKMIHQLKRSLNQEVKNNKLLQFFSTHTGGVILSIGILAGVMLLTGLHFLTYNDFSVVHRYRFSYQGFLGEEVLTKDFSAPALINWGKVKIFWYPPKPFTFVHNVSLKKIYYVNIFMVLKETEPSGLIDRFFHFFREEWGRGYSGVELRFSYKVVQPELWSEYDYDGRGSERLARDLESYILQYTEKKRQEFRRKLYQEEMDKIESHFRKCLTQGKISEWIRRFLYPSLFDVYRTGSMYERYVSGLRWLQEHPRMATQPEWKEFVEHEIKNIEKLMQQENETLISRPLKVKKLIKRPSVSELQRHPNLYQTLSYLVVDDLINGKILEDVEKSAITGSPDPVTEGLIDWLKKNCRLQELVGIKLIDVERHVRKVSALGWQNELRKRENLI